MSRHLVRITHVLLLSSILFGYTAFADDAFELWKSQFKQVALERGITAETLDTALRGVLPDSKVLRLDSHQPEFTKTVWEYLDSAASKQRIKRGRQLLAKHRALLTQIEQQYGVQPEYLVAIWGVESNYGSHKGDYSVIRSIATLAYEGRKERREFWRDQLIAALKILQSGDMSHADLRGSWAGAIGHTQFIPTTFADYAVDFDGDGQRDLVNSIPDALASAANYLSKSGWQPGQLWGAEVELPADFEWEQAEPDWKLPESSWATQNIKRYDLASLNSDKETFVFLPAGHRGPAFLAYPNFHAILKYNNANSYALAVGHLGDRIRGQGELIAEWPRDDRALSRLEKVELQALLTVTGFDTEGIDGKVGPKTRNALRAWQTLQSLPSDGYATPRYLDMIRKEALDMTAKMNENPSPAGWEGR